MSEWIATKGRWDILRIGTGGTGYTFEVMRRFPSSAHGAQLKFKVKEIEEALELARLLSLCLGIEVETCEHLGPGGEGRS